jgi:hypothetical protein
MQLLATTLVLSCLAFTGLAAFAQHCDQAWLAVLFACLAGAVSSAFFSLLIGRMQMVQQVLSASLEDIKLTNPLTRDLGQKLKVRLEVVTDLGYSESSSAVQALNAAFAACQKANSDHGLAADPIYKAIQESGLYAAFESLVFPKHMHR